MKFLHGPWPTTTSFGALAWATGACLPRLCGGACCPSSSASAGCNTRGKGHHKMQIHGLGVADGPLAFSPLAHTQAQAPNGVVVRVIVVAHARVFQVHDPTSGGRTPPSLPEARHGFYVSFGPFPKPVQYGDASNEALLPSLAC